jgi:hypothetical protein
MGTIGPVEPTQPLVSNHNQHLYARMKSLLALLLCSTAASGQVLLSTDFNSVALGNYDAGDRVSGWYVAFGDVDVVNSPGLASQALDLNGFGSGGVQQTVTTVMNQKYELSFDWTASAGAMDTMVAMAVNWNTETVAFLKLDLTPISDVGPFNVKRIVKGTGNDTLQFFSRNYSEDGVTLDNIKLTLLGDNPPISPLESDQGYGAPVPEPAAAATWAAVGLCALAGVRRWTRRSISV